MKHRWRNRLQFGWFRQVDKSRFGWMILAGGYSGLVLWLIFGSSFRVHSITCIDDFGRECPDFVVPAAASLMQKNIFQVKTDDLVRTIGQNLPTTKAVDIVKLWPDSVKIKLISDIPEVMLTASNSAMVPVIGSMDSVLDMTEVGSTSGDLVQIQVGSMPRLSVGDKIADAGLLTAIKLSRKLRHHQVREIKEISSQRIEALLPTGQVVVFSALVDLDRQVQSLQTILPQATMIPNLPVIDLRYDNPVFKPAIDE